MTMSVGPAKMKIKKRNDKNASLCVVFTRGKLKSKHRIVHSSSVLIKMNQKK